MISRRNYFAAVMLMGVLMFLLMGSNALRDSWNDYTVNRHADGTSGYASEANPKWYDDSGHNVAGSVVFLGQGVGGCRRAVEDWAAYTRRDYQAFQTLKTYRSKTDRDLGLQMLIIDAASMDWTTKEDAEYLVECAKDGTDLVFCTLPDADVIRHDESLRTLLGIRGVAQEQRPVDGLYLYAGFLLGGEKLYLPENDSGAEESAPLVFPGTVNAAGKPVFDWYQLGPGTKVYMRGIPRQGMVGQDENPPLIWRRSLGESYVFAVNGGLLRNTEGMGLLAAMAAEMHEYELYPVVNAQNLVLINYPILADENSEQMQHLYSREATDVYQEVLWPTIRHAALRYGYKASCMMTPQIDYTDDVQPDGRQLDYYLKIFNEVSAEAGLSLISVPDTSVAQKVEDDDQFFADILDYDFSSVYAGDLPDADIDDALQSALLSSVVTAVVDDKDNEMILGLLNETTTLQASMNTGFTCTYQQDFRMRCLQTALGYTSIAYNMTDVAYPKNVEDGWEKLSKHFGRSIDGFGKMFPDFEKTTASEAGVRIHALLATKYAESREDDIIRIRTEGADDMRWFILRTHNEAVERVDGGGFMEIENGAYLIEADESEVLIHIITSGDNSQP